MKHKPTAEDIAYLTGVHGLTWQAIHRIGSQYIPLLANPRWEVIDGNGPSSRIIVAGELTENLDVAIRFLVGPHKGVTFIELIVISGFSTYIHKTHETVGANLHTIREDWYNQLEELGQTWN